MSAPPPWKPELAADGDEPQLVPALSDEVLDDLLGRLVHLHDTFKRQEFVFRVKLGHELLQTLYAGRYHEYHDRRRSKSEALSQFCRRHAAHLEARDLREDALRKCIRVAEIVPDPYALPEQVTFSHLLELVALPDDDRAWFLKNKVLNGTVAVKELRDLVRARMAELRAREIEHEEAGFRPEPAADPADQRGPLGKRRYVGNVPRRVDAVLNGVLAVSRDLAPEVLKRPEVAGEALEKWLKVKEEADWWVEVLTKGEEG